MAVVMLSRTFRYGADRLCLASICFYFVNRFWIKPSVWGHSGFFHDYLNDVLLIPIFLPPVLWLHRCVGIRLHDHPPTGSEVFVHWLVWSLCFLMLFPKFTWLYRHSTPDPWNAAAYAAGAAGAWVVWHGSERWRALRSCRNEG